MGRVARPTNTQFAVAVHVMTLLAGAPDEVLSSERLAGSANANPVHVRRVLGALRREGLVRSRPGVHGGWQLEGPADSVTLAEVWRAVQGDDPLLGLHGAAPECTVGQRIQHALGDVDRRAARAVEEELARTTVHDLARQTRPRARAGSGSNWLEEAGFAEVEVDVLARDGIGALAALEGIPC
jgi:Rrf2 family protein